MFSRGIGEYIRVHVVPFKYHPFSQVKQLVTPSAEQVSQPVVHATVIKIWVTVNKLIYPHLRPVMKI